MKNQTCKNCGYDKEAHDDHYEETCKKFEAIHSPLDDQKGDVKGLPNISEKVMKGFMSSMEDVKKGNYIIVEKGKPQKAEDFDLSDISRGTKCFGAWSFKGKDNKHYFGAFPNGFLNWLKKQGWYYGRVCHICSGTLVDSGSYRVDIRPEVKPDLVADGRKDTGIIDETFDVVIIDPPYSLELSKNYGTEKFFGGIDSFTKEAFRIVKNNGLVVTLSYQIPKRIKGCGFIAVWGIYTIPSTSYMRCLTVSKKRAGEKLR